MNYLTYPTKVMNITQNYSSGSTHTPHSQGIPKDYPIDDACADTGRDYFYCPCDRMKIARIYGVGEKGTNTIWMESTEKVVMPCGTDFVTIMVIHPDDDTLSKLKVGQTFGRGDKMFLEGKDGNATGNHFHIAVGTGKISGGGWTTNNKSAWVLTTTGKPLKPEEAFYVDDDFTTIKNAKGITFKKLPRTGSKYIVQAGAFDNKDYADALAEKLKKAGFEAIVRLNGDVDADGKVTAADARAVLTTLYGRVYKCLKPLKLHWELLVIIKTERSPLTLTK